MLRPAASLVTSGYTDSHDMWFSLIGQSRKLNLTYPSFKDS
jgi:hypothetical protein